MPEPEAEATDVWANLTEGDKADDSGEDSEDEGEDLIESIEQIFPFQWLLGKPRKRE